MNNEEIKNPSYLISNYCQHRLMINFIINEERIIESIMNKDENKFNHFYYIIYIMTCFDVSEKLINYINDKKDHQNNVRSHREYTNFAINNKDKILNYLFENNFHTAFKNNGVHIKCFNELINDYKFNDHDDVKNTMHKLYSCIARSSVIGSSMISYIGLKGYYYLLDNKNDKYKMSDVMAINIDLMEKELYKIIPYNYELGKPLERKKDKLKKLESYYKKHSSGIYKILIQTNLYDNMNYLFGGLISYSFCYSLCCISIIILLMKRKKN